MINPQATDATREDKSVSVARREEHGNALDVQLTIGVGEEGALKILMVQCRHLPWLDHRDGFPQSLRESLDSARDRGLDRLKDENESAPLVDALAGMRDALERFFQDLEQIDAPIHLCVLAEEHALGGGRRLLRKFSDTARRELLQELRANGIKWRQFNKQIELNASNLRQDDTDLKDKVLTIQLGETPQMDFNSKRAFLLTGVRLKVNDLVIAENIDSCIINEKSNTLGLPQIPVRHFDAINKTDGKLELVLILGAQRREISFPVQFKLPALSEAPIALFIDMGSTTTKSARVHLSGVGISEVNLGSVLRDRIDTAANSDGEPEWATIHEPEVTPQYLEGRGIPPFNKAELAKGADSALAAWVAEAIRKHAQNAADRRNAALSHVFWSFPQTGVRDFAGLNKELQRRAGAFVLDRIVILPEHECLRRRFGDVLSRLAAAAGARKHEHDKAVRKKKKYDESWFGWRYWFGSPGQVPSLEKWHRRFVELNADPQLREVIIIDAGGFSLDVHASVRRDGEECRFDNSFATGGTELTKKFQKFLAKERGKDLAEVTESEAERIKLRICGDENYNEHDYAKQLSEFTSKIYSKKLREVAAWLRKHTGSKALPVILTGGGMENRFLRELVSQTLKEHDLASDFITSPQLQTLILRDLPDNERDRLRLFVRLTTAFNDRTNPRIEFDIVGGLIQVAQERE